MPTENTVTVIRAELGEYKNILVLFRDRNRDPIDISTGWDFEAVAYSRTQRLFTKDEAADFDLSGGEQGELRIPVDFDTAGKWKLMVTATRDTPPTVLKPTFVILITEETIPEEEEE